MLPETAFARHRPIGGHASCPRITKQGGIDRTVDVLDAGIGIQQGPAHNYEMLASGQQHLARARWVEALRHHPRKDFSRVIVQHRLDIDFRSVEQLDERGIDVPDFVWLRSSNTDGGLGRMNTLAWSSPTAFTDKFGPGGDRGKDLADSLGISSQGAKSLVAFLGRPTAMP